MVPSDNLPKRSVCYRAGSKLYLFHSWSSHLVTVTASIKRFLELGWEGAFSVSQAMAVVVLVVGWFRASVCSGTICEFGVHKMFSFLCPELVLWSSWKLLLLTYFLLNLILGLWLTFWSQSEVKGLMIPEERHLQDVVEVSTALMLNELVQFLLSIFVYQNLMHIKIMNQWCNNINVTSEYSWKQILTLPSEGREAVPERMVPRLTHHIDQKVSFCF